MPTNTEEKHNLYSRAVIAGTLQFPALLDDPDIAILDPLDFFGGYSELWKKTRELGQAGKLSTVNLVNTLPPSSGYDLSFFVTLRQEFAELPLSDLSDYARGLRNYSGRKNLNEIASRLASAAHSDEKPEMVAGWAMEALAHWAMDGEPQDEPIASILLQVFDDACARAANPADIWGIPYGFGRLDMYTGGLQPGELVILGGEPGVGKTWWATQIAMQAAQNCPGVFLSLEMRKKDIVRRMMQILGVNRKNMLTGRMEQEDWHAIDAAMNIINRLPITINDRPIKLHQLHPILSRHKMKTNAEWFVLDYLYLIDAPGRDEIEKTQAISRQVKLICKDLSMAGIVIHSVNKQGMDNKGESGKSKLRGSGQVVHDADIIYMLTKFQPAKGDPYDLAVLPARQPKVVTLHIEKGRELPQAGGIIHYERRETSPGFDELIL